MKALLKAFVLLLCTSFAATVLLFVWIGSRGVSAKAQPGRFETTVARLMRRLAVPRSGLRQSRSSGLRQVYLRPWRPDRLG